jgi:hypothetical protein
LLCRCTGIDTDGGKRTWRQQHALPTAQRFFAWVDKQFEAQGLLRSNPLTKALAYVRERRDGLLLYSERSGCLDRYEFVGARVARHSNGQKELDVLLDRTRAKQIGIAQSLLVTCKLHDIDPYDYLVDVLQRVGQGQERSDVERDLRTLVGNVSDACCVRRRVRRFATPAPAILSSSIAPMVDLRS